MVELFQRLEGMGAEEIKKLTSAMRRMIVYTIEHYMKLPLEHTFLHAPQRYAAFGVLLYRLKTIGHNVSVVTFNYDLGVDLGLWIVSLAVDYCLDETGSPDNPKIELMKLHGSINWAVCDKKCGLVTPCAVRDVVAHVERRNATSTSVGGNIPIHMEDLLSRVECLRCHSSCTPEPMIIPPNGEQERTASGTGECLEKSRYSAGRSRQHLRHRVLVASKRPLLSAALRTWHDG